MRIHKTALLHVKFLITKKLLATLFGNAYFFDFHANEIVIHGCRPFSHLFMSIFPFHHSLFSLLLDIMSHEVALLQIGIVWNFNTTYLHIARIEFWHSDCHTNNTSVSHMMKWTVFATFICCVNVNFNVSSIN